MAGHITGTGGESSQDHALPDAAWFAEHIMGWKHRRDTIKYLGYIDKNDNVWYLDRGLQRAWNPLTDDADALQLLNHMTIRVKYITIEHDNSVHSEQTNQSWYCCFSDNEEAGYAGDARAHDNILRLAICRAVYAWWLAQQDAVHNDGTVEESIMSWLRYARMFMPLILQAVDVAARRSSDKRMQRRFLKAWVDIVVEMGQAALEELEDRIDDVEEDTSYIEGTSYIEDIL